MGVAGTPMPDLENAGCILFWGYNPSVARLAHATATVAALKRGARLIVVDPRRVGLANKADVWLRVRPGTDAALALGIANVMIERGWYDRAFVRDWTNGPLLVRADNGRLLTERDLSAGGSAKRYVAWDARAGRPLVYDPCSGTVRARRRRAGPLRRVHDRRRRAATSSAGPRSSCAPTPADRYAPATVEAICRRRGAARSRRPPGCSGSRGRSPTTPGAASSSRPTPPRSLGRSRCSTR